MSLLPPLKFPCGQGSEGRTATVSRAGARDRRGPRFPCRGHSLGPPPGRGHFSVLSACGSGWTSLPSHPSLTVGLANQRAGPWALRWSRDGHTVKLCQGNATLGPEAKDAVSIGVGKSLELSSTFLPPQGEATKGGGWVGPAFTTRCLSQQPRYILRAFNTCYCWDRPEAGLRTELLCDPPPGIAPLQASVHSRL